MADETSEFLNAQWGSLRLQALSTFFDLAFYLILCLGVVGIHFMRLGLAAIGVDTEVIKAVHWMEKGANLILFGSFFWRIVIRAIKGRP